MNENEMEALIRQVISEANHPRVVRVQTFAEKSGSEARGVHVEDSDGSEGFVRLVTAGES